MAARFSDYKTRPVEIPRRRLLARFDPIGIGLQAQKAMSLLRMHCIVNHLQAPARKTKTNAPVARTLSDSRPAIMIALLRSKSEVAVWNMLSGVGAGSGAKPAFALHT
jgi:hypothetical protein